MDRIYAPRGRTLVAADARESGPFSIQYDADQLCHHDRYSRARLNSAVGPNREAPIAPCGLVLAPSMVGRRTCNRRT